MPLSDDDIKALMTRQAAPPPASTLNQPIGASGMSDDQIKALMQTRMESPTAPVNSPKQQLQGGVQQFDPIHSVQNIIGAYTEHWGIGDRQAANSLRGMQYLYGQANPNDYRIGEGRIPIPKTYQDDFLTRNFVNFFGPVIETLPSFGQTMAAGAVGAGGGAAIGAGAGLAGGPLAEVTVPGGATVGAVHGFTTGVVVASANQSAGDMYMQLREAGLSDDQARPASISYGAIAGLLAAVPVNRVVGKPGMAAMQKWAEQAGLQNIIKRMAVNAGINAGIGTVQNMTDLAIRSYVGAQTGHASIVTQDWGKAFVDSLVKSAQVGIPMAGATEGAHALIGTAAHTFITKKKPTLDHAALAVHEAAMSTGKSPIHQGGVTVSKTISGQSVTSPHTDVQTARTIAVRSGYRSANTPQSPHTAGQYSPIEPHTTAVGNTSAGDLSSRTQAAAEREASSTSYSRSGGGTRGRGDAVLAAWEAQQKADEQIVVAYDEHIQTVRENLASGEAVEKAVNAVLTESGAHERIQAAEKQKGAPLTPEEKAAAAESKSLSRNPLENAKRVDNILNGFQQKFFSWANPLLLHTANQEGRGALIFRDHPDAEKLAITFGTHDAEQKAHSNQENYNNTMYGELSDGIGLSSKDLLKLMAKSTNEKITVHSVGMENDIHFTADEAMQSLLHMRNDKARNGMRTLGWTFRDDFPGDPHVNTTEKALHDALYKADPNYIGVVNSSENVYRKMFPGLAEAAKQFDGRNLKQEEFYGGKVWHEGEPEEAPTPESVQPRMPGESNFKQDKNSPASIEERTSTKLAYRPVGLFRNMHERIVEQSYFEAMAEPSKLWNDLVTNRDFKNGVVTKDGIDVFRSYEQGYKDVVHGVAEAKKWNLKVVEKIMKANMMAELGFKPIQIAKHAMTMVNFMLYKDEHGYIPAEAYLNGLREFATNPAEAIKLVQGLEVMKTRYPSLTNAALGTVVRNLAGPKESWLTRVAMAPFKFGDQLALYPGAYSVYKHVLAKTGSAEKAERAASKAVNDCLASGMMSQMSDWSKGQAGRMLHLFAQPGIRLVQHQLDAIRLAQKFPTKENQMGAVRAIAFTHIAAAAFVAPEIMAGYMFHQNQDKMDAAWYQFHRSLISGSQFGPIGYLIDETYAKLYKRVTGNSVPEHDYTVAVQGNVMHGKAFIDSIDKQLKGEKQTDISSVVKDFINGAQGAPLVGVGVSVSPAKIAEDVINNPNNPFYIGGWFAHQQEKERY